jgi:nucleotide-binding universal stress UspA family protein
VGDAKRIVVGVDGSPHSAAALEWTARLAREWGAEVVAVYVVNPAPYYAHSFGGPFPLPVELDPEWRADMTAQLSGPWTESLAKAGVPYRTLVRDGRPAAVLGEVAEAVGADLIVVGRHGRGAAAELLLGSVSHELVLHSRRPVLIVSPAGRPAESQSAPAPLATV